MPQRKARARSTPKADARPAEEPRSRSRSPETGRAPIEEALSLWTQYARDTGETVTEFLRRFGDEQQKVYDTWAANLSAAASPKPRVPGAEDVRRRLDAWNRQA
jgi:hypothetical protein